MVLSATFPKGNSLLIFFSIISPPFIDPYLKIGKLLILSTFTLSIFLIIEKYLFPLFLALINDFLTIS